MHKLSFVVEFVSILTCQFALYSCQNIVWRLKLRPRPQLKGLYR